MISDVVIVGGGIAGLMTANRLAQLGTRAVVLERGSDESYLCNTRYTGGTFHVCLRDVLLEESALKVAIDKATAGFVSETWAGLIARESRRVVRWLQEEGVRFMKVSAAEHHKWVLAPPGCWGCRSVTRSHFYSSSCTTMLNWFRVIVGMLLPK